MKREKLLIVLLLVLSMAISVMVRIVPLKNYVSPATVYKNLYLQTTHDAYHFMLSTEEIEKGPIINKKPLKTGLGYLGFFMKKVLPYPLDNIAFFSPVFYSALTAVPIFIIGCSVGGSIVGFSGAVTTALSLGYYLRTRIGYYDTDMLNLFFPLMTVALLILFVSEGRRRRRWIWIVLCAVLSQLYYLWYRSGIPINYSIFFMAFLYILLFQKGQEELRQDFLFMYILSSRNVLDLVCGSGAALAFLIPELALAYLYKKAVDRRSDKAFYLFVAFFAAIHLLEREFYVYEAALTKLGFYIAHPKEITVGGLTFPSVSRSISEVKGLSFSELSTLFLKSKFTLVVFTLSAVFMFAKEVKLLPLLPIFVLGLLSFKSNRLIMYLPPALGLGFGYLLEFLRRRFGKKEVLTYLLSLLLVVAAVYPVWPQIKASKFRPVLFSWHVKGLDHLRGMAKRKDIGWTWWDYGYIIQYFSLINTYGDGGAHDGNVIWPLAITLVSRNQTLAANVMDLCAFVFDEGRGEVAFKGYTNTTIDDYLKKLSKSRIDFGRKRDVYFILFDDIVRIFGWIYYFGTWDFVRETGRRDLYFMAPLSSWKGNIVVLGGKLVVDVNRGIFTIGNRQGPLHRLLVPLKKGAYFEKEYNKNAKACLLILPHMGVGVLMDRAIYYSNYFRMMFTNSYDKGLFELVYDDYPRMRVYRLK